MSTRKSRLLSRSVDATRDDGKVMFLLGKMYEAARKQLKRFHAITSERRSTPQLRRLSNVMERTVYKLLIQKRNKFCVKIIASSMECHKIVA